MRRILSIALALVMLLSIIPAQVISEGDLLQIEEIVSDGPEGNETNDEVVIILDEEPDANETEITFVNLEDDTDDETIEWVDLSGAEDPVSIIEEAPEAEESAIAVSLSTEQRYAVAGMKSFSYQVGVKDGVAPYAVSVQVSVNDEAVYSANERLETDGEFSFEFMPDAYGDYTVAVLAQDETGATAEASAQIPVSVNECETADAWARSVKGVALTGNWAKDLVNVAKTQIGYEESQRNFIIDKNGIKHGYTRYGDWYGAAYSNWCAIFVSFCLNYAEIPSDAVPYAASCNEWISRFESMGVFMDGDYAPKAGDIVFFDLGDTGIHVGIVIKADGNEISTVEGNISKAVARQSYATSDARIIGYASMNALMEKAGIVSAQETEAVEIVIDDVPAEAEEEDVVLVVEGETETTTEDVLEFYFGAPEVFAEPSATTVALNDPLKISVTLKNFTSAVTYQWQKSANNGKTWNETNLYGNQTNQLSFKVTNASRVKYMYRCAVTDADGNVYYSNGVLVNLVQPEEMPNVVVTASVNSSIAYPDSPVKMTVAVTNSTGNLTYQWQKTSNNGNTWSSTNLYGNQTKELSFKASDSRLRWIYRCAVTDENGTYYSNTIQVSFVDEPEPFDTVTVTISANKMIVKTSEQVAITATVEGAVGAVSYQWQQSADSGATWVNNGLSTSTQQTLSFPAATKRNEKYYRCVVTDENGIHFSDKIKVVLDDVNVIVAPEQESISLGGTVVINSTIENTVGALTYQWERCKINSDYISNTSLPGNKTDTLSFAVTEQYLSRLDYQYRLAVTDEKGTHYSNWVVVTLQEEEPDRTIKNVIYRLTEKDEWTVIGYTGTDSSLTVEEKIDEKNVTRIGQSAFANNQYLVSIDLPDTIEVIEKYAFKNCSNLASMN